MRPQQLPASLLLVIALSTINMLSAAHAAGQTGVTVYNFTGAGDGGNPLSTLVMDRMGNLYGTTFVGGAHGAGEVFELSLAGGRWIETVLYSFTGGVDGANPYYAGVVFDAAGNLYGTTVGGGAFNLGAVFEMTPGASGWNERVLYSFAGGSDGASPYAGLTFDAAGNLYGTTYSGGSSNLGTAFEMKPAGGGQWTESVIQTFTGKNGESPAGGLVLDTAGNVFGVTLGGGKSGAGIAFMLSPASSGLWTETILHSFTGGTDGGSPYAERLVFDSRGDLYGTTSSGGATQQGTVFRLSRNTAGSWSEAVLYSFDGTVAANPYSGVIFDARGNLYGTCANGNGVTTVGAVFELSQGMNGKWSERNLLLFTRDNGEFPEAALLRDASGNLYGTTLLGGASGMGVVFEVKP